MTAKLMANNCALSVILQLVQYVELTEYASVKKPIPVTTASRTWYHPKGALSTSARAIPGPTLADARFLRFSLTSPLIWVCDMRLNMFSRDIIDQHEYLHIRPGRLGKPHFQRVQTTTLGPKVNTLVGRCPPQSEDLRKQERNDEDCVSLAVSSIQRAAG